MNISDIRSKLLKEYKKTLDPSSKFYNEDLNTFKSRINRETSKDKLERQLGNLICLSGKNIAFNKKVRQISKELERGGMYDVKSMKPENALD